MSRKIFKGIWGVAILISLLTVLFVTDILAGYFEHETMKRLEIETGILSDEIGGQDGKTGVKRLQGLFGVPASGGREAVTGSVRTQDTTDFGDEIRVTLVDQAGKVLYDSVEDAASLENHQNREEIRQARSSGSGSAARYSASLSKRTMYYAVLLKNGSVLRLSAEQRSVMILLISLLQPIIVLILLGAVISGVLSHFIARRIVQPINEIDPDHPDIDSQYVEISPLIRKMQEQKETIYGQMNTLRRKQSEQAVIMENMAEGLVMADRNGNVLSMNAAVARMFHVRKEEVKSAWSIDRSQAFLTALEGALSGKHTEQNLKKDDREYLIIASPVFAPEPAEKTAEERSGEKPREVEGAAILLLDRTEKLRQDEMRREFTANVSHELKTPLTSIYGVADMLQGGLVEAGDVPHFASEITKESKRMIRLIDDIIQLSALDDASILQKEKTETDLFLLSGLVKDRLKEAAARNHVTVSVTGKRHTAVVYGVGTLLEEVIYNLVDNAIKYNREGGRVEIRTEGDPVEKKAFLVVADTGIGIPENATGRIFERFYRVDKSHSRQIGGTGLGLSIVKHIVLLHKGTIHVESEEGKGTKMTVIFPME